VSFTASANRGARADGPWRRIRGRMPRRARIRLGGAAAASVSMAAAVVLTLAASAGASTSTADTLVSATVHGTPAAHALRLRAMPAGTVTFGRRHGRLTVHAVMLGLTPGSSHSVNLVIPAVPGLSGSARSLPIAPAMPAASSGATSRAICGTAAAC